MRFLALRLAYRKSRYIPGLEENIKILNLPVIEKS